MTTHATSGAVPQFTLADRLRKARETTGLDQDAFADRIRVSRGTVSNAETGARKPLRATLYAWALASGVDLGWLETGVPGGQGGPGDGLTARRARRYSKPQPSDPKVLGSPRPLPKAA